MNYRTFGRTGVKLSPLVLGTDNFANPTPEADAVRMIDVALDAGINLLDTSNSYRQGECEEIIGRALKAKRSAQRNAHRHQVSLSDRARAPTIGATLACHIMRACEESLRRLQTDCHRSLSGAPAGSGVPQDETLSALTDLVRQGKVRYIGSSTAPAWKIMEAIMVSELKGLARFVSDQPPYNLLDRRIENELVPMCQAHGLGILTWSPLAMGILAGRYADTADLSDGFAGHVARRHLRRAGDRTAASKWATVSSRWRGSTASIRRSWPFSGSKISPASPRPSSAPKASPSSSICCPSWR